MMRPSHPDYVLMSSSCPPGSSGKLEGDSIAKPRSTPEPFRKVNPPTDLQPVRHRPSEENRSPMLRTQDLSPDIPGDLSDLFPSISNEYSAQKDTGKVLSADQETNGAGKPPEPEEDYL